MKRNQSLVLTAMDSMHEYEVRPGRDPRGGVDVISDAPPFGRLWYDEQNAISNGIGYATHFSRSLDAMIRVYDNAGNVIGTQVHKSEFERAVAFDVKQKAATR